MMPAVLASAGAGAPPALLAGAAAALRHHLCAAAAAGGASRRAVGSWATVDVDKWSGAQPAKAQNLGASSREAAGAPTHAYLAPPRGRPAALPRPQTPRSARSHTHPSFTRPSLPSRRPVGGRRRAHRRPRPPQRRALHPGARHAGRRAAAVCGEPQVGAQVGAAQPAEEAGAVRSPGGCFGWGSFWFCAHPVGVGGAV